MQAIIPIPSSIRNIDNFDQVVELHKKIWKATSLLIIYFCIKKIFSKKLPKDKIVKSNQIGNKKFTLLELLTGL